MNRVYLIRREDFSKDIKEARGRRSNSLCKGPEVGTFHSNFEEEQQGLSICWSPGVLGGLMGMMSDQEQEFHLHGSLWAKLQTLTSLLSPIECHWTVLSRRVPTLAFERTTRLTGGSREIQD